MEAIDAAVQAHEARLIRDQDEAEAGAMARESAIYAAERGILRDYKLIDQAFVDHNVDPDIENIGYALAKMYQAYVTGVSTEERNGGVVDYFALDIAPIYERCITAAATEEVDNG